MFPHGVIIATHGDSNSPAQPPSRPALLCPQSQHVQPVGLVAVWVRVMSSLPSDNNEGLKGSPRVKGHCQNYLVFNPDGEEGW